MLSGSCHCGAVHIEVARKPRRLTSCNCSICHRYGTLWAYYKATAVRVICEPGATTHYCWGDKTLHFVRCSTCGCIINWQPVDMKADSRIGVNARNLSPETLSALPIRRFDGSSTWKYLD